MQSQHAATTSSQPTNENASLRPCNDLQTRTTRSDDYQSYRVAAPDAHCAKRCLGVISHIHCQMNERRAIMRGSSVGRSARCLLRHLSRSKTQRSPHTTSKRKVPDHGTAKVLVNVMPITRASLARHRGSLVEDMRLKADRGRHGIQIKALRRPRAIATLERRRH